MATRIILAEDDSVIRMDLKEELQRQGYLVVGEVGDGESAVNLPDRIRQARGSRPEPGRPS